MTSRRDLHDRLDALGDDGREPFTVHEQVLLGLKEAHDASLSRREQRAADGELQFEALPGRWRQENDR